MIGPSPPVHPGEILREEFQAPLGLTPYAVARACRVLRTRIERLARGETPVTADTALAPRSLFRHRPRVLDESSDRARPRCFGGGGLRSRRDHPKRGGLKGCRDGTVGGRLILRAR